MYHSSSFRRLLLTSGWQRNIKDILQSYYLATHYDSSWYKAWHTWALANFEVVGFLENQQYNKISDVPGHELTAHIVSAVIGFFHSISLRNENALQDTLRLLTLWFKYGAHDDVSHAMSNGFTDVEVDTWLEVIPQVCNLLHRLVMGYSYPCRSLHAYKHRATTFGGTSTICLPKSESTIPRRSSIRLRSLRSRRARCGRKQR